MIPLNRSKLAKVSKGTFDVIYLMVKLVFQLLQKHGDTQQPKIFLTTQVKHCFEPIKTNVVSKCSWIETN